jgi:choline dehydrogenase-like flavoprotein
MGALTLSASTMRRERLLNYLVTFTPRWSPSVETLRRLTTADRRSFLKYLGRSLADLPGTIRAAVRRAVHGRYPVESWILDNQMEIAPNADSRVTLDASRDALGLPRVRLDWRLSPIDKRSLWRTHEIIGRELKRAGLGALHLELDTDESSWPSGTVGAFHHMGTTRMDVTPRRGVVDADCRVHGIRNLFVAGSSVFPTGGASNPTLTIVALALRLAEHLKRRAL